MLCKHDCQSFTNLTACCAPESPLADLKGFSQCDRTVLYGNRLHRKEFVTLEGIT